jgi:hypothetical protein
MAGVEFGQPSAGRLAGGLVADRRLFLTSDNRLVEDGAADAAFQLISAHGLIPAAEVERLGLELKGGKIVQINPPAALPSTGLLGPRGALEAAVKDRIKADMEVRFHEETDKEVAKITSAAGKNADPTAVTHAAANRAAELSEQALKDRESLAPAKESAAEKRTAGKKAAEKAEPKSAQGKARARKPGK